MLVVHEPIPVRSTPYMAPGHTLNNPHVGLIAVLRSVLVCIADYV